MHRSARRVTRLFLLCAVLPPLCFGALLFAYDPLALWHAPWGREATLHKNMRFAAVGAMRRAPFESALLGTSIMENMSAAEASRVLGSRFANLSLTASDYVERRIAIDYLLDVRPVQQLVYSLDKVYLTARRGYTTFPLPTWDFLYDGNRLNDARVYLNGHFLRCLRGWSKAPECVGRAADLDRPNAWADEPEHSLRFGGIDKWCAARTNYQVRDARNDLRKATLRLRGEPDGEPAPAEVAVVVARALAYVEENVVALVRRHPQTRFRMFFPPNSRAQFAIWHQSQPHFAAAHEAVIRLMAQRAGELPNLELHGFETEAFLDDIANYKDFVHYAPARDAWLLTAMRDGTHRLGPDNVEAYIAQARQRALGFDIAGLLATLEQCLGPD